MRMDSLGRKFLMMNIGYYALLVPISTYFAVMLDSHGYSETFVGTLLSAGALTGIAIKLILGYYADKHGGSKQIFLYSALLCSLCAAGLVLFCGSIAYLVFYSFVIIGLSGSIGGIHESWMLKTVETHHMKLSYGTMRGFGSIAYAGMCLFLGYAIERWGYEISAYVALIFGAITVINAARTPGLSPVPVEAKKIGLLSDVRYFVRNKEYLLILAAIFLANITYNVADMYTPLIFIELGGSSDMVGLGAFVCGFSESFVMIASPRIARRFGYKKLFIFGLVFYTVKYFSFSVVRTPVQMVGVMLFQMVSYGLVMPASVAMISKAVDDRHQATALQIFYIVMNLPRVFFGTIAGSIFENFGYKAMLYATCPFGFIGAVMMFCYYFLHKDGRSRRPALKTGG